MEICSAGFYGVYGYKLTSYFVTDNNWFGTKFISYILDKTKNLNFKLVRRYAKDFQKVWKDGIFFRLDYKENKTTPKSEVFR